MKILNYLFVASVFLVLSCGEATEANAQSDTKGKALRMTPIVNPQTGELMAHIPLPKDWKLEGGSIVGPNGVKTMDYQNQMFLFEQRMPMNLEDVLRQDIAPSIYKEGGKILGTFVIPELENYDRAYSDLLWKFGNPVNEFHVLGVDCVSPDGKQTLLIFRQMISQTSFAGNWGYYVNALDADADAYEEAKKDYIFALCHVQPNMEQIQRYNQKEIARSNASWAQHQSRMAANQAAFNARNQAWMQASNDALDISMQGWRSRNAMSDQGQANAVNGIREEQTITDPSTGQPVQVEAGSNRYFTNGNNEYISTDDYFYQPNLDNSVNQYEWKEWTGN